MPPSANSWTPSRAHSMRCGAVMMCRREAQSAWCAGCCLTCSDLPSRHERVQCLATQQGSQQYSRSPSAVQLLSCMCASRCLQVRQLSSNINGVGAEVGGGLLAGRDNVEAFGQVAQVQGMGRWRNFRGQARGARVALILARPHHFKCALLTPSHGARPGGGGGAGAPPHTTARLS
jgi:hypothetical protein